MGDMKKLKKLTSCILIFAMAIGMNIDTAMAAVSGTAGFSPNWFQAGTQGTLTLTVNGTGFPDHQVDGLIRFQAIQ